MVTVNIDGQTAHGGSAGVIVYTGGTSQISEMCTPEKSGECFDCCQGFEISFAIAVMRVILNYCAYFFRAVGCMASFTFSEDDNAAGKEQPAMCMIR